MKPIVSIPTILFAMFTAAHAEQPALAPGLISLNGADRTMDGAQPKAEALAISGTRIVAVGSTADLRALVGTKTRVVDAGGKSVLPGFNDAHVHWLSGGYSITNVDLRDASSREEFANRIAAFAKKIPPGRWILGGEWDHEKFPGAP